MQHTLTDFLKYTPSQKEVSLAIAQDNTELAEFIKTLESQEFRQVIDTTELFKYVVSPSKVFLIIRDKLHKDVYDFILQYPTGQVEIFDTNKMKIETANPLYKDVAMIFILTKDTLAIIQKTGYQLLENVGITYQS